MDRRILTVDWLSRLFSIVGLVGTLGVGLYVYNESQQEGPDASSELIEQKVAEKFAAEKKLLADQLALQFESQDKRISQQVAASVKNEYDTRFDAHADERRDLDSATRSIMQRFDADAHKLLDSWEAEANNSLAQREDKFDRLINTFDDRVANAVSRSDQSPNVDDEFRSSPESGTDPDVDLRVARLSLRPASATALANGEILVQNLGTADATITMLEFIPKEIYESSPPTGDETLLHAKTRIVFTPKDNHATKRDEHREYIQVLAKPVTVPAGKTMSFRIEIDNPVHLDYGFKGVMKFSYNDGKELEVPNARVRFIDDSEGSA